MGLRLYVSIDFEGLPGVPVTGLVPKGSQYGRSEYIATIIAKAVAEELLSAGASRVVIADSHGLMTNIDYKQMPRGVSILQGYPRPLSMITGIDEGYDAAFFVGYHAAAGTQHGYLDHTISGAAFHKIMVDGYRASEYLLNAMVAGKYNVPVVLIAGDRHLRPDVEKYTPWAVFVELKRGLGRFAAVYDSLEDVLDRLKDGVREAVERAKSGKARPLKIAFKEVLVEFKDTLYTDMVSCIPGIERIDAYTVKINTNDPEKLLRILETAALMCYGLRAMKERLY